MPFISIFSIVSSSLTGIISVALFCLALWQSKKHIGAWLMVTFLGSVGIWSAAILLSHLGPLFNFDSQPFILASAVILGLGGPLLFGSVTYQLGLWRRQVFPLLTLGGILFSLLLIPLLRNGLVATGLGVDTQGFTLYELTAFGYLFFFVLFAYQVAAILLLMRHFTPQTRALLWGCISLSIGTASVALGSEIASYPLPIISATIAAIFFCYAIVRDHLFSPLFTLNQQLEETNRQLEVANQNARRTTARLEALLKTTTDLVWSVDSTYRFDTLNVQAAQLFSTLAGRQPQLGDVTFDFLPKTDQVDFRVAYDRALAGQAAQIEKAYVTESGTERQLELVFNSIEALQEPGTITGVSVFGRDITAHKEIEDRLLRQSLAFENISDSVLITNLAGLVVECNPATERIFGYSREELVNGFPEMWHDPDEPSITHEILKGLELNGRWEGEIRYIRKNGQKGICVAVVLPLYGEDGELIGRLGVSRDITHEKQKEVELQESRTAAEAANRAKSAFLASMSHELRTPLNAILGYSELLQHDAAKGEVSPKRLSRTLERVKKSGQHLLTLINDILELSKIEANTMALALHQFDLHALMHQIEQDVQPLVEQNANQLTLTLDSKLEDIVADPAKVRQIVWNLLSNAAKFTHQGTIRLTTQAQERFGVPWFDIQVEDTGIGMTAEATEHIFQAFTQADGSSTRRYEGVGLGLTLCHQYVQMLGGEIRVESEPDVGSTFTVSLPVGTTLYTETSGEDGAQARETAVGDRTIKRLQRNIVLVIDSNPYKRDLLVRWLYQAGYRVYTANSSSKGLTIASRLLPTLIFLDPELPSVKTGGMLQHLKASEVTRHTPIIATAPPAATPSQNSSAPDAYLNLPLNQEELIQLTQRFSQAPQSLSDPHRILIVEDNYAFRDILRITLERDGFEVTQAVDSYMALEHLNETHRLPDVMILDLMLPGMSGFELIKHIKKVPTWAEIPIIITTAKQLTEADHDFLAHNTVSILSKGFYGQAELIMRINQIISDRVMPQTLS